MDYEECYACTRVVKVVIWDNAFVIALLWSARDVS